MAKHLSDRTKKKIIADRVDGMTLLKIAAKYGCSEYAVRKVIKDHPEITKKIEHKKEQNTLDMLAYMDSRTKNVQKLLDLMFDAMADPERLSEASMRDLATCAGILIDKFAKYRTDEDSQTLKAAKELLEGVPSVID